MPPTVRNGQEAMMNSLARSVVPGRCPVLRHFLFCAALTLVGGLFAASAQAQVNSANGSGAELAFRDAAVSAAPGSQGRRFNSGGPSTSSKWAVWAGLGAAIPRGDLANTNKRGSAVGLGFEYALNNKTSIEATLAGNSNDGKGASADINVTQLGVNGKFYFTDAPLRVFVTAGLEAYSFDPGSTRFGGSFGAGLQYRFASKWSLEGRLTQHGLTDNPPPTTPPTFLVALRYAF